MTTERREVIEAAKKAIQKLHGITPDKEGKGTMLVPRVITEEDIEEMRKRSTQKRIKRILEE